MSGIAREIFSLTPLKENRHKEAQEAQKISGKPCAFCASLWLSVQ
jgi:hypothetical protein